MPETPIDNLERTHNPYQLESIGLGEMADIIAESNRAFLAPSSDPTQTTEELLASMSRDPKFMPLGYRVGNIPISYIIALSHNDSSTISIGPMYVAAAHQGQGLGRKQVQDFNDWAQQQGYTRVFTKTWLGNRASRRIFESLDFINAGLKPGDRANGDTTITYFLQL